LEGSRGFKRVKNLSPGRMISFPSHVLGTRGMHAVPGR
jgi:hypothetical protein